MDKFKKILKMFKRIVLLCLLFGGWYTLMVLIKP